MRLDELRYAGHEDLDPARVERYGAKEDASAGSEVVVLKGVGLTQARQRRQQVRGMKTALKRQAGSRYGPDTVLRVDVAEEWNAMAATRRVTGAAGLAVAALFIAGNALWATEQPQAGASAQQIVAFYTNTSGRVIVGASVSLVAGALFVLFAAGLRAILDDAANDGVLGATAFGGALVVVTAGLGAETINMAGALRAEHGQLSGELGRALFEISYVLGYNAAGVGVGILILAVAVAALRTVAVSSLVCARPSPGRARLPHPALPVPVRTFTRAAARRVGSTTQELVSHPDNRRLNIPTPTRPALAEASN